MSPFEIIMLICFGAAWPFALYKSYSSRSVKGKSFPFLIVVIIGYASGILHKIFYHPDNVVFLYALNMFMVMSDAVLYVRNARIERAAELEQRF